MRKLVAAVVLLVVAGLTTTACGTTPVDPTDSPWENGYNDSFNGTLGEEVLKREISYSLEEAKVLIEQWRREYNTI